MKKIILTAVLTAGALTGFADAESHQAAAEKLVSIISPKEIYVDNFNAIFESQVEQFRQMGINDQSIDQILKASNTFANQVADDPELAARLILIYQEAYTEEELKELKAFYETPIGKKTLEVMPRITQQEAIISQQIAVKYQPQFQKAVQDILEAAAPVPKTGPGTTE